MGCYQLITPGVTVSQGIGNSPGKWELNGVEMGLKWGEMGQKWGGGGRGRDKNGVKNWVKKGVNGTKMGLK